MSMPNTAAKSLTTESGTTPAISWISVAVIGVGGLVEDERREADCRYVIARRKSPDEVDIKVSMTGLSTLMCSASAMYTRRDVDEVASSGVKRNLEQRDARGSIILVT